MLKASFAGALFILALTVVVQGQQPVAVPAVSPENQLKIRNLQYEQDRKLLEMQRVEARYKELQEAVKLSQAQIEEAVRSAARDGGVNLDGFVFDLDLLRFLPRPKVGSVEAAKPLEVISNEKH